MRTVPPETYHRLGVVSRKFSCEADRDVLVEQDGQESRAVRTAGPSGLML